MDKKLSVNKHFTSSVLALSLMALNSGLYAAPGDMTISGMAGSSPITIKTCAHDAGAVCSLTWNGKEFIDDYDHGRQMQSAVSFDYLGENFNPTEAGANYLIDGFNPSPSSSVLQAYWNTPNILATQTKMAFWNPVGGQKTSNHILNKRITIGVHGLPHVIEYATQYTIPSNESHYHGVFEAVTGYMPAEFSKFWTYNIPSNSLTSLSDGPGEQNLPIIFSTPDQAWAMGVYSPFSPQPSRPNTGYGRWKFPNDGVVKWNNVFRIDNPRGVYHFRSYVIVGSLQDVRTSMASLYNVYN